MSGYFANKTREELDPVSITLNGEEQLEMIMDVMRAHAECNEDLVHNVLSHMGTLVDTMPVSEAVSTALAATKHEFPRFLAPLLVHTLTKTLEIEKREIEKDKGIKQ